ncbi:hypothetical protein EJ110_NYTH00853 [Nymphaea thermarum]|nr:hypothetical protein EJ110_NYTH00853 [Nymphaea thermarum]
MATTSANSFHLRSISLPSTSHPTVGQVEECLNLVKRWVESSTLKKSDCSSVTTGLCHLKGLHLSTIDFLQLPLTQQSLRRQENWVNETMEALVGLLDVCEMAKDSSSRLREQYQFLNSLVRRRDSSLHESIGLYQSIRKKMKKDMVKCLRSLRSVRIKRAAADDAVICGTLSDVIANTISVFELLIPVISGQNSSESAFSKLRFLGSKKCDMSDECTSTSEIDRLDAVLHAAYGSSSKESREDSIRRAQKHMVAFDNYLSDIEPELESMWRCWVAKRHDSSDIVDDSVNGVDRNPLMTIPSTGNFDCYRCILVINHEDQFICNRHIWHSY